MATGSYMTPIYSRSQSETPSPNFHTTPTGGLLNFDRFNVHHFPTHRGSGWTRTRDKASVTARHIVH
ncbi:hypothetical protein TNCV_2298881 [Trichonephila clavipes]|nr:hypothetical protein TNCV_2298881 [Trichonephila clavipes]